MINLDIITNENNKEDNKKWPYIPDHPYRILIIGGSGSGTQVWIFDQKMWICRNKTFQWSKYIYECSNTIDDVYENIDD